VGGNDSGVTRFLLLMCFVPLIFGWLLIASFLTCKIFPEGSNMRMEWPETLNTFGMLYQVLFVVIVVWMAQPFRIFGHPEHSPVGGPDGDFHLVHYPDILAGSSDHGTMLMVSIICFLVFILTFLSYYIFQLWRMPSLSADDLQRRTFIYRAYRFMFMRFRASAWYWGGVLLLRTFYRLLANHFWSCYFVRVNFGLTQCAEL